MVHGWGLHGGVWQDIAAALGVCFTVTVVDLPGYGTSRELPAEYTLEVLAAQVLELCHAPVIWVGWSLGAMLGITASTTHASALAGLVLIGATPKFVQSKDWPHGLPPQQLRQFADDLERDYPGTLKRFLSLQVGVAADMRGVVARLRRSLSRSPPPDPRALRAGLDLLRHTDLRPALRSVIHRVQVIHGERDRLAPIAAGAYLADHLAAGKLQSVARAGHAPFLSHPELVRQRLMEWRHE